MNFGTSRASAVENLNKFIDQNILLVEPVPYNIENLEKKFSKFENIYICKNAIFSQKKTSSFYYVDGKSINKLGKHWASGIGSFNKQHILDHKSKRFNITEDDIEKIEIEFITFDNLVDNYKIASIDNLQIDVEGAEFEILKSINFEKISVKSIQFESKHFDGTFFEGPKLKFIKEKLKSNGYNLVQLDKENILAKK